jgi:hypothetical protein
MCAKSKSGTNAPITHDCRKLKQKIGKQEMRREKNNELSVHVHTHTESEFSSHRFQEAFFIWPGGAISLFIT